MGRAQQEMSRRDSSEHQVQAGPPDHELGEWAEGLGWGEVLKQLRGHLERWLGHRRERAVF
eukprot:12474057-Alexandrium_andersonii.AAC.1